MAWIDDRIWCHPKFTDISSPAFRAYINAVAYSAGMATRGALSPDQQKLVGIVGKVRKELVAGRLLDAKLFGFCEIHDWDEHNGKRDDRRAADRERKRLARAKERELSAGTSAGQSNGRSAGRSTGQSAGTSTGTARAEGSDGSEGSEEEPFLPSYVDLHEEQEGRIEIDYDHMLKSIPE